MNGKELKRASKSQLLELLLAQTERIESLERELKKTQKDLASKKLSISESGTLSEASLKLSNIFASADEAIEIYKKNIIEEKEKEYSKINNKKLKELEKYCNKKKEESKRILDEAKKEAKSIIDSAKNEAEKVKSKGKKKKK